MLPTGDANVGGGSIAYDAALFGSSHGIPGNLTRGGAHTYQSDPAVYRFVERNMLPDEDPYPNAREEEVVQEPLDFWKLSFQVKLVIGHIVVGRFLQLINGYGAYK